MSPTVFREKGYRFFFFSREESRMHVHVASGDGEAKYWLEPKVELATSSRYHRRQLKEIESLIQEHYNELVSACKSTLPVEVTHISADGVWILARDKELFMPYDEFPWFKDQPVKVILNVEEPSPGHFYWPDIDVDLTEDIIENPQKYPNRAKVV